MLKFFNKNKQKEEKEEKKQPEVETEIKNPHLQDVWNKDDYIKKKFQNRPLEFYIRNYRTNISIAFVVSILSFSVVFLSGFIIEDKKESHDYYITSTDGRVIEHELTQEDIKKMRKAFRELRQKNNN